MNQDVFDAHSFLCVLCASVFQVSSQNRKHRGTEGTENGKGRTDE
jgi:hypothetical protein